MPRMSEGVPPRFRALAAALAVLAAMPSAAAEGPAPAPKPPPVDAGLDPEPAIRREALSDPRNLRRDELPPIRDPKYAGALEARHMDGEEWVLGVVIGKTALAYPVNILNQHEIVVDAVEGVPFLVCW